MDKAKIIKGLQIVIEGLSEGSTDAAPAMSVKVADLPPDNLAVQIAESYQTYHPEFGIDNLVKDVKSLAENPTKFGYLVGWMRKKGCSGLDSFYKLTKEEQQKAIIEAVTTSENTIRDILTRRFPQ